MSWGMKLEPLKFSFFQKASNHFGPGRDIEFCKHYAHVRRHRPCTNLKDGRNRLIRQAPSNHSCNFQLTGRQRRRGRPWRLRLQHDAPNTVDLDVEQYVRQLDEPCKSSWRGL